MSSTSNSVAPRTVHPNAHLLRIPNEIRNNIYDLVFIDDTPVLELKNASLPSKELLLACRQINNEAALIYRTAYRQYWSQTTFKLLTTLESLHDDLATVSSIPPRDLRHITDLRIEPVGYTFRRHYLNGFWTSFSYSPTSKTWEAVNGPRLLTRYTGYLALERAGFYVYVSVDFDDYDARDLGETAVWVVKEEGESERRVEEARAIVAGYALDREGVEYGLRLLDRFAAEHPGRTFAKLAEGEGEG